STNPKGQKILVPGLKTTANLLLNIYLQKDLEPIPIRYDLIIDKLLNEEFLYGVIIHEERFTFEARGLEKVIDLGEFWEKKTGKLIPLGAIAIRRDIELSIQKEFERSLRESLSLAYKNPNRAKDYSVASATLVH
ncbi:MAG: menaquinone biosynthesis protein, partial [Leptospira sp.]|nr:menaquinone biosynthesis protein [Leptospira sp.]